MKPAVAVLSTGSVSFPLNRPVCALYGPKVSVLMVKQIRQVFGGNLRIISHVSL